MNKRILGIVLGFLIWLFVLLLCLPYRSASNELKDLNSKIDKIVIFLDLDAKDEVVE
jgi:hypothetical protein